MAEDSAPGIPRIKLRIESLSDLVFGLALSLGAIALIQQIPQDPSALMNDVATFTFSFLIIVAVWLGYTRIASVLPIEDSGTLVLNLVLLFCVALEPFLYYVFERSATNFLDFSSAAFALDTGAMMAILSAMMYLLVRHGASGKLKLSPASIKRYRIGVVAQAFAAFVFLVSASDIFWVQVPGFGYLRFYVWYFALAAFIISRAARRFGAKEHAEVMKD
ncbi:MAG: TMEM175 family protein [Thaumarchaeota archaeon]|nr:TMEM175 family protein [Nitrososphaerota archaeon]